MPLKHQFAFPTMPLPRDVKDLPPEGVPILISVDITKASPATINFTLVHGWLIEPGTYEITFALYSPDGEALDLGDRPAFRRTFTGKMKPLFLAFHHVELTTDDEGRFEIEAICDGEVAVRYPFYIWQRGTAN